MKHYIWRKVPLLSALFLVVILSFLSCKKPTGDIGLNVQPANELLNLMVTDTFTIEAHILIDDSIRTSKLSSGIAMLGSYYDNYFGISNASIFCQPLLSTSNVDFTPTNGVLSDVIVDSLVLSLAYDPSGYYGALTSQSFSVYRVLQNFYADSDYYTFDLLNFDSLTNSSYYEPYSHIPTPYDSVLVGSTWRKAQLRIRLDDNLGQDIINLSGTSALNDNDSVTGFLSFLKGLYIRVDNPTQSVLEGAVLYLNLLDEESNLNLYYHENVIPDTAGGGSWPVPGPQKTYSFSITNQSAGFTHVSHDYSVSMVGNELNDSTMGQQLLYVQAGGSVKTKLTIPNISFLNDTQGVSVNKAQLLVPVQQGSVNFFTPISRIAVQAINDVGQGEITLDEYEGGDLNIDGTWNESDETYKMNITRQIIAILKGTKNNNGFYLLATSAGVSVNRSVIDGPEYANNPIKLIITHTKY